MKTQKEYRALADSVLQMLQKEHSEDPSNGHLTMDNWEWPAGVALYGIWQRYRQTGDEAALAYMRNWFDRHLAGPMPHRNVNTVGPMLALCCLYDSQRDERYRALVEEWAAWVMRDMPRTEFGGLQHCTVWNRHYQQLWCDTLFMACLFLCKAGLTLDKPEYVEEAKYQFLLHIRYLQNKETGLWYHGWTFDRRNNFAGAYWGRGNAWFTAAAVELLEMLPMQDASLRLIQAALADQVVALWKLQRVNGMFTTLLDVEESPCETSATAGIAYGVLKGVRLGLIDSGYREMGLKAAGAVVAQIDENGAVQGVSNGTGMGHDLEHYRKILITPTAYGQGLTFLMLGELDRESE
ncbi:MAG: glycoside hydrolase family 88 protein [Eubacteriales bacterium]|nr:glycoside hydrolase family 88 protein [Eubacteriales bacterium]